MVSVAVANRSATAKGSAAAMAAGAWVLLISSSVAVQAAASG